MIQFTEIPKSTIYAIHNNHYRDDAYYFQINKNGKQLCIYGVLDRENGIAEAFWILNSFDKKVLSKNFFKSLFNHSFKLGYKEIYTWTRCPKLINVFSHFKKFGIENIDHPSWDIDETKTWFMKRL